MRITVPSASVRRWLLAIAVIVVAGSVAAVTLEAVTRPADGVIHTIARFAGFWLHVDNERNLPSWYSSILLAVVALVAADVARAERVLRKTPWWCWVFVAATFLYLSLDELIQMHEGSSVVSELLLPLVIVFAIVAVPLLWRLPRPIAYQLLAAGAIYVGGSAGIDAIAGMLGRPNEVLIHLEEAAEMVGVAIMVAAVAQYRESLDDALPSAVRTPAVPVADR